MKTASPWYDRASSPDEAIRKIESHSRGFVHGAAATPIPLLDALCRRPDLEGVRLYHLHTAGHPDFLAPEQAGKLLSVSLFAGHDARVAIHDGRADFIPVFLSDIPALFSSGRIALDFALVQVSPPDRHGLCTLGTSVDAARAAVDSARVVIAEVNDRMPRTHGNTALHIDEIDHFIRTDRPLSEAPVPPEGPVEAAIGDLVAGLIDDRSTLQLGIGGIPNAIARRLGNKRDLGLHTETFSDQVIDLVEAGVINNRYKAVHAGRITTSFVSGSRRLFDFVDDNSKVEFHPCDRTNDPALIRQNDRVVAINSALEIDLTGQVCADSIGHRIFSGIGGQMDFIRGAALSREGKPIIALPSTAARGLRSRIVATLHPGAGIVTSRGHIHWVVTEHGAVNLHGLTLKERADALISIAHPDFRAEIRRDLAAVRHFSFA